MATWLTLSGRTHKSSFRYSRVWEDHRLVSKALKIQKGDTVVCITSAGDNVLNLLLDEPKKIVAIDINPAEIALLQLKIAAIKLLTYEDYLCVLGDMEDSNGKQRLAVFDRVKEHLPENCKKYVHDNVIEKGVSVSGWYQEDTSIPLNQQIAKLVEADKLDRFFASTSLEEQKVAFQEISDGLKEAITLQLNKEHALATGWEEKHLIDIEAAEGDICQYFWRQACRVCLTLPASDNFYLSWLFRGTRGFSPNVNPDLAPPFLKRENFSRLKRLVDRIEIYNGTVEDCLKTDVPYFNKINLSDIFERADLETTQAIFKVVVDHMAPGGRLSYWTFLESNKYPSPSTLSKLTYLKKISEELYKQDRMMLYKGFHVYEIK